MKKILFRSVLILLCVASLVAIVINLNASKSTIRVMSYNIRNGIGMDDLKDYQRTANVIMKIRPNFVALQEVDSVTGRSNKVDLLLELAKLTKMYPTYGSAISFDGGKYGVGLLSRKKPLMTKNIALPGREEARTLLIAEYPQYVVMATHWSLTEEDRIASVAIINEQAQAFQKPLFLVGDFNAEPNSIELNLLSDKWVNLSPNLPTYPADNPVETIDYIWGYRGSHFSYECQNTLVVEEPLASDHRPIYSDIVLKK